MKRTFTTVKLGEETRYQARIEDDESSPEDARITAHRFLSSLVDQPELLLCGYAPFQKMLLYHNGMRWIAELEAIIKNPEV